MEEVLDRLRLEGLEWCTIPEVHASWLERSIEEDEIRQVVFELEGDKALGTNGFSMCFFRICQNIVKDDLLSVFKLFFHTGVVCKSMNSNFITLIPKKERSAKVKDFRPISLTLSVYKILGKMLANILERILASTISMQQSARVEGRQILDATLVANEVVRDLEGEQKERGRFQVRL